MKHTHTLKPNKVLLQCTTKEIRVHAEATTLLFRVTENILDNVYDPNKPPSAGIFSDHDSTKGGVRFADVPVSGVFQPDLLLSEAAQRLVTTRARKRRVPKGRQCAEATHQETPSDPTSLTTHSAPQDTRESTITRTEGVTEEAPADAASKVPPSFPLLTDGSRVKQVEEETHRPPDVEEDVTGQQAHISLTSPLQTLLHVPIVSVIMTVHNGAKYIEHAVRSLQFQTLTNWELIVVDDCSSDTTSPIMHMLAREDDRVRYIRNRHNIGCYASKNIGVGYARGAWFTFHDADDCSMSERLEKQLHFCVTGQNRTDGTSVASSTTNTHTVSRANVVYDCCYATSLARKTKVWTWTPITMFIRADVFRNQLGSFDTVRFGADSEMRVRLDTLKLRVGVLDEYLYACPDRWIELGTRLTSLTGNTAHDALRVHYKRSYEHFHSLVRGTYSEPLCASAMKYEFPPKDMHTNKSGAQWRPFPLLGVDNNTDVRHLLVPSPSDLSSTIAHTRIL